MTDTQPKVCHSEYISIMGSREPIVLPLSWLTTDLKAIGLQVGDFICEKDEVQCVMVVAYDPSSDRLWTTSVKRPNRLSYYKCFAERWREGYFERVEIK